VKFSPVGLCIYCGAKDALTAEHIIPRCLNGDLILPKASCRPCSKITGQFEQICCRRIMGPVRIRMNLKTSNPKERPDRLSFHVMAADGTFNTVSESVRDHPTELLLFAFSSPRILLGLPAFKTGEILSKAWRFGPSIQAMTEVATKHRGKGISVGQFDTLAFCRLLAKIGHSLAVAQYGINSFKPLALDLILGRDDEMGHLIGGKMEEQPCLPHLHAYKCGLVTVETRRYVVAEIRLFANLGAPLYHAVIGEVS
jgi:hypothetical protein